MKCDLILRLALLLGVLSTLGRGSGQERFQWTVTFDGPPAIPPDHASSIEYYYEYGITFRPINPDGPTGLRQFGRSGGALKGFPSNGTAYLIFGAGDSVSATEAGWHFGLVSVDVAEYSIGLASPKTVHFVGYRADGSTVTNAFTTDGIIDETGPLPDFQTFYFDEQFADIVRFEVADIGYALDNVVFVGRFRPSMNVRQPVSQSVGLDCPVTFVAEAAGSGPLTFQWQKNGTNLPGHGPVTIGSPYEYVLPTNSTLSIERVRLSDVGSYTLMVTNPYGATTSRVAVLSRDLPPVDRGTIVQRYPSGGLWIHTNTLLANVSDPDGDPVRVIAVDPKSIAGGTLIVSNVCCGFPIPNEWIYYLPPVGYDNADAFNYTVSDGHCGGTANATVLIQVRTDTPPAPRAAIVKIDNSVRVSFEGVPGHRYLVQRTESLTPPSWLDVAALTADPFGAYVYVEPVSSNAPARYYRSVSP